MARTDKSRAPALRYLRTSSAANVGTDKDSEKRQRHAVQGFAKRAGFGIPARLFETRSLESVDAAAERVANAVLRSAKNPARA